MFKFNKYELLKTYESSLININEQIAQFTKTNTNVTNVLELLQSDTSNISTTIEHQNELINKLIENTNTQFNDNNLNITQIIEILKCDISNIAYTIEYQNELIDKLIENHNELIDKLIENHNDQLHILRSCVDQQIKIHLDGNLKLLKYNFLKLLIINIAIIILVFGFVINMYFKMY